MLSPAITPGGSGSAQPSEKLAPPPVIVAKAPFPPGEKTTSALEATGRTRPSGPTVRVVSISAQVPACLVHCGSAHDSKVKSPEGWAKTFVVSEAASSTSTGASHFSARA